MKRSRRPLAVKSGSTGPPAVLAVCTALYFLAVNLTSAATVKSAAIFLTLLALSSVFLFFSRLRDRMGVPLLLLAAVAVMDGASTLYAVSGKFALYEFLKVLSAFCLALLLLALAPVGGADPGRWIAKILAGSSALAGLVSIDLISTRLLSGFAQAVLGEFTADYSALSGLEAGVRMTGMYGNPNVFAGVAGIGVLLSLGLVRSSEDGRERTAQTVILYVNSLSFLLAFSMGATGAIAAAFLLLLAMERGNARLLLLMVETLALVVLAAAVISVTSFRAWDGVRWAPMACTLLGAAGLCVTDALPGRRLAARMEGKKRLVPAITAAVLAALMVFGLAAYHLTGGVTLREGERLRRAAYPEAGAYVLDLEADGALRVRIESQNQRQTMMHTSDVLYKGAADGAVFSVPEDSLVVYFNLSAPNGARVQSLEYKGEAGSGSVPLGYKLLPGFMANRLQGLWANENAIQRLVFFRDGLKLFQRSPVAGLGLGAFENGVKSVQSFYYETKYAHNHYIQALAETGLVGLALFLLLLAGSAAAVFFSWKKASHPLTPALGAALAFMAAHAAVEVVFSSYAYLPMAFGVFALVSLCCGDALPKVRLRTGGKTAAILALSALIAAYGVLLCCNLWARRSTADSPTLEDLVRAAAADKFEWADYALSYVNSTAGVQVGDEVRRQADAYALRLAELDSNTIPIHLAAYYFQTRRPAEGLTMVEKYVRYVSSDPEGWRQAFDLLEQYEEDTDLYRNGVLRVARILDDWNAANMGGITVDEDAQALIGRMGE